MWKARDSWALLDPQSRVVSLKYAEAATIDSRYEDAGASWTPTLARAGSAEELEQWWLQDHRQLSGGHCTYSRQLILEANTVLVTAVPSRIF